MHYLPPSPFPASWHRRVVCAALLSLASMGAAHAAESELAHITVQTSGTTASWSSADAVVEAVMAAARRLETLARDSDAAGVRRELPLLLAEQGKLAGVLRKARKS